MSAQLQSINLIPDEILLPGSSIVVEATDGLGREQWLRAVGAQRVPAVFKVSRDGTRLTWSPDRDAQPGWYEFSLEGLTAKRGKTAPPAGRIRFGLVASSARVPGPVAVEHMIRLRIDGWRVERLPLFTEQPRGKYVELMKASDRRTGATLSLGFDESGRPIEPDEVLARVERARVERFGKLDEHLDRLLRETPDDKPVAVAIWATTDEHLGEAEKSAREPLSEELSGQFWEQHAELAGASVEGLSAEVKELGGRARPDPLAPVVYSRLDRRAIRELARSDRVAAVFAYDPRGFDDLEDSIDIADSDDAHAMGARGRGTHVAVWEQGPDSTTNLNIQGRFDSTPTTSTHSRLVHGVIANTQSSGPNGHAPDCDLFSANSYDLSALRWAVVDERCTVINQSFHRDAEQTSDSLSFDDVYKDWLILRPPYPTIVQAAGNQPNASSEYVNHKGFNSLAVANHNDSASGLAASSVFRNPASNHGDRELPEIAGNGTAVAAVGTSDSGTSFASPAVAGIAAVLQSESPVLRSWPEGCRALLLAGAYRNVTNSTWWQDVLAGVDASDGAGAVNALESYRIVQNRRSRNAAATRRGWDIGSLGDDDFGGDGYSNFVYKVVVPGWVAGPRHVKVALTWNSVVGELSIFGIRIPLTSKLGQDLDLKVYDTGGRLVAHSQSWENSYEIVEFDGQRGAEYTIRVRRYSGSGSTWYGLAWTVTGGFLDLIDIRDLVFESDVTRVLRSGGGG